MENLVYHYTTFENLKSILKSDTFKLSSFSQANDFKEIVLRKFSNGETIQMYNYLSTCAEGNNKGMSLLSFSNSMMWYHYANKWQGVCVEFSLDLLLTHTNPYRHGKINYRNGVTHIDNQGILDYLMEKRDCWNGENEYRLIYTSDISTIFNISHYINAIYFGPEIEEKSISELVKTKGIRFYKTYFDSVDGRINRYELKQQENI